MTPFGERNIEDLRPLERRYDLPIEDDFVVSVLPNGIKTWVYVYERDGRQQRRTLGVYPDMDLAAARRSLDGARATRRSLQEARDRSTRAAETRVAPRRRSERGPSGLPRVAAALATAVVLGAALYAAQMRSGGPSAPAPVSSGTPPAANTVAQLAPVTPAADPPVAAQAASDPQPIAAASMAALDGAALETPMPTREIPAALAVAATTAALPEAGSEPTVSNGGAAGPLAAPRVGSPHVLRALLTGNVAQREPVGELGPLISGGDGPQRVYFFTEVKGLAGQRLRHRWEREGRIEGEVPIQVGASWRWRAYSRKDLSPAQRGDWRVQLLGEDGSVLAETRFSYR